VLYLALLSLPPTSWLLDAADSYAHYASLMVGLVVLASLVELGSRALPSAASEAETPANDLTVSSGAARGPS
jgi:hypothetical protein